MLYEDTFLKRTYNFARRKVVRLISFFSFFKLLNYSERLSYFGQNKQFSECLQVKKRLKDRVGLSLVSLAEYLARLKPQKLLRDETSLVVSNLGCRHQYLGSPKLALWMPGRDKNISLILDTIQQHTYFSRELKS